MGVFDDPAEALVRHSEEMLRDELPTTLEAVGCLNCQAIRRRHDNHRCIVCGSESLFDVAQLINTEREEKEMSGDVGAVS